MNRSVLEKIQVELSKESPNIPYVQGMVDTMLELMGDEPQVRNKFGVIGAISGEEVRKDEFPTVTDVPEAPLPMDQIRKLSEESQRG